MIRFEKVMALQDRPEVMKVRLAHEGCFLETEMVVCQCDQVSEYSTWMTKA